MALDITPRGYHICAMETAWNPLGALLGLAALLLLLGAIQPSEASAGAELCSPAAGLQSGQYVSEVMATGAGHCQSAVMVDCCAGLPGGACAGSAGAILGASNLFENPLGAGQISWLGDAASTNRMITLDPPPPRI